MKILAAASVFLVAAVLILAVSSRYRLAKAGLRVTSWWRSPWKNAEVGGVKNSKHVLGLAFDIAPSSISALQKLAPMGFAKVIDEGSHIHIEVI